MKHPPKRKRGARKIQARRGSTPNQDAERGRADALLRGGGVTESIEVLKQLARRDPCDVGVVRRLATALEESGQTFEALKQLDRIIGLGQADAETWKTTGRLLMMHRETAQALGAYQRSIEINGDDPESRHELARTLYSLGEVEEAAKHLEIATGLCDDVDPWIALATLAPSNPQYSQSDVLRIRRELAARFPPAADQVERLGKPTAVPPRIGYVSSWLDKENYNKPVWALINHHDRRNFEIHLFSDTDFAAGFPGYAPDPRDYIHETAPLNNHQLAELIAETGIDLLIDLNAYSAPHRLGLFAMRLPLRTAAWFNMYATSGFPGVDFIIGDDVTIRMADQEFYVEQMVRLPQSYLSFQVTHQAPPIVDPPCCRSDTFTFGSLVTQYKLNSDVLDAWSEILRRVPSSRLLLANVELDSPSNRSYLETSFRRRGIDANRLLMHGRSGHYEFLEHYNQIDLALDAFPYNGGTTTMEAIWQGVPVVTYDGDRWASRTSASLLAQTHLREFIAEDRQGYIDKAVNCANSENARAQLHALRPVARTRLLESPVCDARGFALAMESIYLEILAAPVRCTPSERSV